MAPEDPKVLHRARQTQSEVGVADRLRPAKRRPHAVVLDVKGGDWKILTEKVNTSIGVSSTTWSADSKSILTQDLDNVYQISLTGQLQRKFAVSELVDDIS